MRLIGIIGSTWELMGDDIAPIQMPVPSPPGKKKIYRMDVYCNHAVKPLVWEIVTLAAFSAGKQ